MKDNKACDLVALAVSYLQPCQNQYEREMEVACRRAPTLPYLCCCCFPWSGVSTRYDDLCASRSKCKGCFSAENVVWKHAYRHASPYSRSLVLWDIGNSKLPSLCLLWEAVSLWLKLWRGRLSRLPVNLTSTGAKQGRLGSWVMSAGLQAKRPICACDNSHFSVQRRHT